MTIQLTFKHVRDTKRTYVFAEIDDRGEELDRADATVDRLYIKQRTFDGEGAPKLLTVSIAYN